MSEHQIKMITTFVGVFYGIISLFMLIGIGCQLAFGDRTNKDYFILLFATLAVFIILVVVSFGVAKKKNIICAVILFALSVIAFIEMIITAFHDKIQSEYYLAVICLGLCTVNFRCIMATLDYKKLKK